jgi:hypothetical protein
MSDGYEPRRVGGHYGVWFVCGHCDEQRWCRPNKVGDGLYAQCQTCLRLVRAYSPNADIPPSPIAWEAYSP